MDTTEITSLYGRRKKRNHSPEFKAAMVAACQQPGVSKAAVALAHGLNANVLRRWVVQSERAGSTPAFSGANLPPLAFMALPLKSHAAAAASLADGDIRIERRRDALMANMTWPVTAASECGA